MASMTYPNNNRTFILTWEGMSFSGKQIDLLVEENGERVLVGSINSKEELQNGKEFDLNGEKIHVQHKKVFAFIKELAVTVGGEKLKGNSVQ